MIKLENYEVVGWEHAIRGMRNPMNSWEKSDSKKINMTLKEEETALGMSSLVYVHCDPYISLGENDHALMMKLRNAGPDHRKFMRMITVYVDITAPLYWWKEFDTYKVGTVANSCSTMHKIHEKSLTVNDFSCGILGYGAVKELAPHYKHFTLVIDSLNNLRDLYLKTGEKVYWDAMIQMLPSSYNQKRTIMFNYEVLANIYKSRKNHKLDEWRELCTWVESLPYSELITGYRGKPDFTNHDGSHDYD